MDQSESNYKKINAAQQLEDPDSVFHYYQKLIRLRKEKDIIVYGEFEPLYREDEQILRTQENRIRKSF